MQLTTELLIIRRLLFEAMLLIGKVESMASQQPRAVQELPPTKCHHKATRGMVKAG